MLRKGLIVVALVLVPAVAIGARLQFFEVRTSGNFLFDIMVDSTLGMSNGLRDAYDGCYTLRVSGIEVRPRSAAILWGGRGVISPRFQAGQVKVSRQVYVPEVGDWARYYDLFVNETKTAQTVDVEIFGNLGSDSSTKILSSSDGDTDLETSDSWFSTDDYADGSGDPSLAHVYRRARGKLRPEAVSLQHDDISIRFRLKIRPRKSAAIVFFAVQTKNAADANALAAELTKFGPDARARLAKADIRLIAN